MRMLQIGRAEDFPLVRSGRGQQPLIIHAAYNIGKLSVVIFLLDLWIKRLKSGRQNDRSDLYFFFLRCLLQIYCFVLADRFANTTFLLFEIETAFVNVGNERNRLGEVYMDGFIIGYFLIILVRILRGAIFYTGSTTCAFVFKNIPWLLRQGHLEVSCFSFYTVYLSVGEDLNIWVPADLDQLGCENSHGTVISWKGLVQLRHVAADARPFFNQVDLKPGGGKIERSLNAADSSANDHHVSKIRISKALARQFSALLSFHFLSPHNRTSVRQESVAYRRDRRGPTRAANTLSEKSRQPVRIRQSLLEYWPCAEHLGVLGALCGEFFSCVERFKRSLLE
jgi:hypothetical protein